MKGLFGSRYKGIVVWKSAADLPKIRNGEVVILNKDFHWTAIYRKNGQLHEYDSFNRDLLGDKYKDAKVYGFQQPITETNCGQRTIAFLIHELLM